MADEPIKAFLNGVDHLVTTAERSVVPQTPDDYHVAMQARAEAESLIDHAQQKLMFLMQRLKKLPALPEFASWFATPPPPTSPTPPSRREEKQEKEQIS